MLLHLHSNMGSYAKVSKLDLGGRRSTKEDNEVLYRVASSDVVGRHMVAVRDIHPGEVIFTDKPACIGG